MSVTLLVNGVDKTTYVRIGSASFTQPVRGQRGSSRFVLENLPADSFYTPVEGQSVVWKDGSVIVFQGTIDTFDRVPVIQSGGGYFYTITAVSLEQRLDKRFVTRAFPIGTTAGAIVTSIMGTEASAEGIAIGSISDGVTLTIAKIYDHARISDVFTELASLSDNYTWYIDPADGKIYFAARTTTPAPFTVVDANVLALTGPSVSTSRSEYRNRQHVKISETNLLPEKQTFQGDGATTSFTLSKSIRDVVSIVLTTATGSSIIGTYAANPSDGDFLQIGPYTYVFKNTLPPPDTATFFSAAQSFVFIQPFLAAGDDTITYQNLVDCILGNDSGRGTRYSASCVANPAIASAVAVAGVSGGTITLTTTPGAFWNPVNFAGATTNFSWGTLTDAVPGAGANQSFAERGSSGSGSYQWIYDVGGTTIEQATGQTPPQSNEVLIVEYKPIGFGVVTVDDKAEQAIRAAAEGGSGIYENLAIREDLLTLDAGLAAANALLVGNEHMTERVTFDTDTSGLLPGQYAAINDTALNVNGNYLIQSVTGSIIPAASGDYWRYRVLAVSGTQTTIEGWAALANKGTPGGVAGSTGSSSKLSPQQTATGSDITDFGRANFGIDDDTVGTNVALKYVPVTEEGVPYIGYVTIGRLSAQLQPDTILDILYSDDHAATWTSIFPADSKIIIPPTLNGTDQDVDFEANPRNREITTFNQVNLQKGWLLRLDSLQSGGATDIVVHIKWKPSGTRGMQGSGIDPGNALVPLVLAA